MTVLGPKVRDALKKAWFMIYYAEPLRAVPMENKFCGCTCVIRRKSPISVSATHRKGPQVLVIIGS